MVYRSNFCRGWMYNTYLFSRNIPRNAIPSKEKLNFTFKIVLGQSPGFEQENGSWTGDIGESIIKRL